MARATNDDTLMISQSYNNSDSRRLNTLQNADEREGAGNRLLGTLFCSTIPQRRGDADAVSVRLSSTWRRTDESQRDKIPKTSRRALHRQL
jgi:hypothetical protein